MRTLRIRSGGPRASCMYPRGTTATSSTSSCGSGSSRCLARLDASQHPLCRLARDPGLSFNPVRPAARPTCRAGLPPCRPCLSHEMARVSRTAQHLTIWASVRCTLSAHLRYTENMVGALTRTARSKRNGTSCHEQAESTLKLCRYVYQALDAKVVWNWRLCI